MNLEERLTLESQLKVNSRCPPSANNQISREPMNIREELFGDNRHIFIRKFREDQFAFSRGTDDQTLSRKKN